MTATYSLSVKLTPIELIPTPFVIPENVEAIVPAFNDQDGLNCTLASLADLNLRRIIVVDDGSECPLQTAPDLSTPVLILRHSQNKGAAAARNTGLSAVKGDWVYFTDCGCTHPKGLINAFAQIRSESGSCVSAIVGPVKATENGRLSEYYTHQGILNPPVSVRECGSVEVETIVTANALVSSACAKHLGGFDETFPSAGGEDTDFGIRLRTVGHIVGCEEGMIFHEFQECLEDFDARMRRYGRGMRLVAEKLGFDLRPRPFLPFDQAFVDLAERQYLMMLNGYDECPLAKTPNETLYA